MQPDLHKLTLWGRFYGLLPTYEPDELEHKYCFTTSAKIGIEPASIVLIETVTDTRKEDDGTASVLMKVVLHLHDPPGNLSKCAETFTRTCRKVVPLEHRPRAEYGWHWNGNGDMGKSQINL